MLICGGGLLYKTSDILNRWEESTHCFLLSMMRHMECLQQMEEDIKPPQHDNKFDAFIFLGGEIKYTQYTIFQKGPTFFSSHLTARHGKSLWESN